MPDSPTSHKPSVNPVTVWIPIVIMAMGLVVFYNYMLYTKGQTQGEKKDRPPYINKAEDDLILTERSGRQVRLSELRGKILLISWLDVHAPGVLGKLKELMSAHVNSGRVHVVAFAVDSETPPEALREVASGCGLDENSPWWLVTGDAGRVRDFMTRELRFKPIQPGADKSLHDTRICLLDDLGNVRRLADVLNQDPEYAAHWENQLRKDLQYLLKEKDEASN